MSRETALLLRGVALMLLLVLVAWLLGGCATAAPARGLGDRIPAHGHRVALRRRLPHRLVGSADRAAGAGFDRMIRGR